MKNILVTGAGGFVGRNISEYLGTEKEKYRVFAARRTELDLLDEEAVAAFVAERKIDVVIHCAGRGGTRKTNYDERDVVSGNLRMFFNLVRALPPSARMVSMGSGAEYDKRRCEPRISEERFDAYVPADGYGYSKYVISKYIEKADSIVCLRIFGLYGKYEDYTYRFISNAIVKNLLGAPILINQNMLLDYLYMPDFCRIVEGFIGKGWKHKHYNVTPSRSSDLAGLAGLVNAVSGKPVEIKVLNPGMNAEYSGSNARLVSEMPGFKFTGAESAIAEMYRYYSAELPALDLETVRKDPYLKFCPTKDKA